MNSPFLEDHSRSPYIFRFDLPKNGCWPPTHNLDIEILLVTAIKKLSAQC